MRLYKFSRLFVLAESSPKRRGTLSASRCHFTLLNGVGSVARLSFMTPASPPDSDGDGERLVSLWTSNRRPLLGGVG